MCRYYTHLPMLRNVKVITVKHIHICMVDILQGTAYCCTSLRHDVFHALYVDRFHTQDAIRSVSNFLHGSSISHITSAGRKEILPR